MKLISGSSNPTFAQSLSQQLRIPITPTEISQFANGEKRVWIKEPIKGDNVVLVQSFSIPADEHIMETLLLIDAVERLGARHVNLVIPWLGYSLQDKVFRQGEPIAAKVVANIISNSYVKRAFLMDLHNSSTPGFFSIPTQHLSALESFVEYVRTTFSPTAEQFVVASPDFGGLKRARVFAEKLGLDLVNIDKHRDLRTGEITTMGVSGDVQNKNVLIFDDCINGGGTVVTSSEALKKHGAASVHFLAAHGPLVPDGWKKIEDSIVDSVIVTNSLEHPYQSSKLNVVDIAPLFATELATWMRANV